MVGGVVSLLVSLMQRMLRRILRLGMRKLQDHAHRARERHAALHRQEAAQQPEDQTAGNGRHADDVNTATGPVQNRRLSFDERGKPGAAASVPARPQNRLGKRREISDAKPFSDDLRFALKISG